MQKAIAPLAALCLMACQAPPAQFLPDGAQAMSLLGRPLFPPSLAEQARKEREAKLAEAKSDFAKNPNDPDAAIWVGRRHSYLGQFREAVAVYSAELEKHPEHAKLLRHRGHRYITLRNFEKAVTDLEKAATLIAGKPDEPEPDGTPNAQNIPSSTLQSNVWYHLGLAHYLQGDFPAAARSYEECRKIAKTPDQICSSTYWLYNALRRAGFHREAQEALGPIRPEMVVGESRGYHKLLLIFQGSEAPESVLEGARKSSNEVDYATVAYGIANWHLVRGKNEEARKLFLEILQNAQWPAFGYIAAEVECQRRGWVAR